MQIALHYYDHATDTMVTLNPLASGYWDVTTLDTRLVSRRFGTKTDARAFYEYTVSRLKENI